jgi:DNA-binding transcriptional regulator YhcF (GntR family)
MMGRSSTPKQSKADLTLQLAMQIRAITVMADTLDTPDETLPTTAELARTLGVDHEAVKKQLKYLKETGLIRTVGMNPKRLRFDSYAYRSMLNNETEDSLLETLLTQLQQHTIVID